MSALVTMWRSVWRFHWLLAGILVLEYALAFAIVVTAASVLVSRVQAINQSSGVHEQGLYVLQGRGVDQPVHRSEAFYARKKFEALAGHSQVAMASNVPFGGVSKLRVLIGVPGDVQQTSSLHVDAYQGGVHFLSVLGLRLLHGRDFNADEIATHYGEQSHVMILSQALAQRLFHDGRAVGKQVMLNGQAVTVVGVVKSLAAPRYSGSNQTMYTLLLPHLPGANSLVLVRYAGSAARLQGALKGLQQHDHGKVHWQLKPYSQIRARYFQADNLVVDAFAGVIGIVLVTAICGILGLTNYWISRRRRQIAIRRALGANKRDILWHFFAESGLLVVVGMGLGAILSFVFVTFLGVLQHGAGVLMWALPVIVIGLLAAFVVHASLRRWLRLQPVELIRTL